MAELVFKGHYAVEELFRYLKEVEGSACEFHSKVNIMDSKDPMNVSIYKIRTVYLTHFRSDMEESYHLSRLRVLLFVTTIKLNAV